MAFTEYHWMGMTCSRPPHAPKKLPFTSCQICTPNEKNMGRKLSPTRPVHPFIFMFIYHAEKYSFVRASQNLIGYNLRTFHPIKSVHINLCISWTRKKNCTHPRCSMHPALAVWQIWIDRVTCMFFSYKRIATLQLWIGHESSWPYLLLWVIAQVN